MAENEKRGGRLLAAGAAARLAGVNRTTVWRAAERGELAAIETCLGRLFRDSDVEAWSARRVNGQREGRHGK